jgi:uncharacterized protein (DUF39 family)
MFYVYKFIKPFSGFMAHNIFYLPAAHMTVPLITAVTGIATIVKVLQNFELRACLADNADCVLYVSDISFSRACKSLSIEEKSCDQTTGEKSEEQKNKRAKAAKFFMQKFCSLRRRKNGADPERREKMMNLRCFLGG